MNIERAENSILVKDDKFTLTLNYENNDLELWADLTVVGGKTTVTNKDIYDILKKLNLYGKIITEGVQSLAGQASMGKQPKNIVIMRGKPAEEGLPGRFNFLVKPSKPISCESAQGLLSFDNVNAGQAVARVVKPTPGVPGLSLKGEKIQPEKLESLNVDMGDGIRMANDKDPEDARDCYVAKFPGRVVCEGSRISITDSYVIDGKIDTKTGNIDFVGSIEIRGDIAEGMAVKAGKKLTIKGNVEPSYLEAGSSIEMNGGVYGKKIGKIKCGGSLEARYIDECNVECQGNVIVKNEILESHIKTLGFVDVSNGSIIGGQITAQGGIEAKMIGSDMAIKTVLISGKNYVDGEHITALNKEVKENKKRLEQLSNKLDFYVRNPGELAKLRPEDKQKLREFTAEFTKLNMRNREIPKEIQAINEEMNKKANPMISVSRRIHRNVEMYLCSEYQKIMESETQNVTYVINSFQGGIRTIPRIRLIDNARKFERESPPKD